MITKCPNCGTIFNVRQIEIRQAEGLVRCGQCSTIFNSLVEQAKESSEESYPENNTVSRFIFNRLKNTKEGNQDMEINYKTILLLVGLCILFMGQIAAVNSNAVMSYIQKSHLGSEFCEKFNCSLPLAKEVKKIVIVSQELTFAKEKDALSVSLLVKNTASFDQPMPDIVLSLSGLIGENIAHQLFPAGEYLPRQTNKSPVIPLDSYRKINFLLKNPGKRIGELKIELL